MTDETEQTGARLGLLAVAAAVLVALVAPLAVLVRDGWRPLREADLQASHTLTLGSGPGRAVVTVLTQLGAPVLLEAAAVLAAVLLVRRGGTRRATYLLACVLGAELLSALAKHLVDRVRPCAQAHAGCPLSSSFPSGHAFGAAAFWSAVAVLLLPALGRAAWSLAVAVPLLVALTRVLLGVHYPTDVVAGLLLGWSWTAAVTAVVRAEAPSATERRRPPAPAPLRRTG